MLLINGERAPLRGSSLRRHDYPIRQNHLRSKHLSDESNDLTIGDALLQSGYQSVVADLVKEFGEVNVSESILVSSVVAWPVSTGVVGISSSPSNSLGSMNAVGWL